MAKFKCKHSGNVFSFEQEQDIKGLREHPDYEEVIEEIKVEKPVSKKTAPKSEE